VAESWQEFLAARNDADRKKILAKHRKRESTLRGNFSKFFFKLKVYEEWLEQQRPVLTEIEHLNAQLERAKHPKTKKDAAIDSKALHQRLKLIEAQMRIDPQELLRIVAQAGVHIREAHKAKTEMVEANLRFVISIAKEVHQPRPVLPRPDPGGQHGPDEGGREVRVPPRLQVFHLRHVVDPAGDHPLDRRPGPHHPHPGPHDRDA
jgi:hypothetical protein